MTSTDVDAERPPARRGTRDERREATLRALAGDQDAHCAYCGRVLPPIPPQGGRPTPYCAPDPQRYGRWGAKVITCAMLDEHREIWVTVYGPDQPMTVLDTRVLDAHLADALTALDPLTSHIGALRAQVTGQTAAALAARADAETARDAALEQARIAQSERADALAAAQRATAQAQDARDQAESDRAAARAAEQASARARTDRDAAIRARDEADQARQRALEQVTATQDRVGALQAELAGERATALERLDQARRDADDAQQALRATLTAQHEIRLRERAEDFDTRARAIQADADQRVTELAGRLAQATRSYADSLAPLHDQIDALRTELTARATAAADLRRQLDDTRAAVSDALDADDEQLRPRLRALIDQQLSPRPIPSSD